MDILHEKCEKDKATDKKLPTDSFLVTYKVEDEIKSLLKIKNITYDFNKDKISGSAYLIISDTTLIIPLKNIVDTDKEIAKLNDKKNLAINNLEKLSTKLSNSSFLNKAPVNIIEKFKKEAEDIKSSIEKIDQIIDTII